MSVEKNLLVIISADEITHMTNNPKTKLSIVVKDGLIKDILPLSEALKAYPNATYHDYKNCIISSFFCDHHAHFFANDKKTLEMIADNLLRSGIGFVYEAGSKNKFGPIAKTALAGKITVHTSIQAIYKKGYYGSFLGIGVNSSDEAKNVIKKLKKLNVDFIKIINSGIIDPENGLLTNGGFTHSETVEIIQYAKNQDLPVHCHVSGAENIKSCIKAGATAIVHGFYASEETLSLMAKNNTSFIPTINALNRLKHICKTNQAKVFIDNLVSTHQDTVNKAHELGVKILAGSDSGPDFIPYGIAYLEELQLQNEAGLPLKTILKANSKKLQINSKANFVLLNKLNTEIWQTAEVFIEGRQQKQC